jgi:hypothetical protein
MQWIDRPLIDEPAERRELVERIAPNRSGRLDVALPFSAVMWCALRATLCGWPVRRGLEFRCGRVVQSRCGKKAGSSLDPEFGLKHVPDGGERDAAVHLIVLQLGLPLVEIELEMALQDVRKTGPKIVALFADAFKFRLQLFVRWFRRV